MCLARFSNGIVLNLVFFNIQSQAITIGDKSLGMLMFWYSTKRFY